MNSSVLSPVSLVGYLLRQAISGQPVSVQLLDPARVSLTPEEALDLIVNSSAPAPSVSSELRIPIIFRPPDSHLLHVGGGIDSTTNSRKKKPAEGMRAAEEGDSTSQETAGAELGVEESLVALLEALKLDEKRDGKIGQELDDVLRSLAGSHKPLFTTMQSEVAESGALGPVTLRSIGFFYSKKWELQKAVDAFQRSNSLEEDDRSYRGLSVQYRRMGELDEALRAIERAIQLNGTRVNNFLEKAIVLRKMGRLLAAFLVLEKALRLDGRAQEKIVREKDHVLEAMRRSNFFLLRTIRRQLLKQGAPKAEILCSLGVDYAKEGQFQNALDAFYWSHRIAKHARTYCEMAVTYRRMGFLDAARSAIDQAIELNPTQGRNFYEQSKILREMGLFEEARSAIDEAIRLNPTEAQNHYENGMLLREMGLFPEALRAFDKAVELDSTNQKYLKARNKLLQELL